DEAAVAAAEAVTSPQSAEDVVQADLEQLVGESSAGRFGGVLGNEAGQQLAEDVQSGFAHISHEPTMASHRREIPHRASRDADRQGSGVGADVDRVACAG